MRGVKTKQKLLRTATGTLGALFTLRNFLSLKQQRHLSQNNHVWQTAEHKQVPFMCLPPLKLEHRVLLTSQTDKLVALLPTQPVSRPESEITLTCLTNKQTLQLRRQWSVCQEHVDPGLLLAQQLHSRSEQLQTVVLSVLSPYFAERLTSPHYSSHS